MSNNNIRVYKGFAPEISRAAFVAPSADIIGRVELGPDSSVFYGAVLRGDIHRIIVGARSNIQEHALLHTSDNRGDCIVGNSVTVGHRAILHGCHVNDFALIGMGAIILDDAEIGSYTLIGAGSLVKLGTIIPSGVLAVGSPAKVIRELTEQERADLEKSADNYVQHAMEHAAKAH